MARKKTSVWVFVCCGLASSGVSAQDRDPFWIDVNIGPAHARTSLENTRADFGFESRNIRLSVDYPRPVGGDFDFGAGRMFNSRLGVGISVVGTGTFGQADTQLLVPSSIPAAPAATAVVRVLTF
jgi:hypothetical protein